MAAHATMPSIRVTWPAMGPPHGHAFLRTVPVAVLRGVRGCIRVAVRGVRVVPVIGIVEVREDEHPRTAVPVGERSATEAAAPELSASPKTPTGVAAAESTAVAAPVPSPHGGPCRTASQRDHEEGGEEQYWHPTVPMSCGAGHDHTPEATAVPAAEEVRRPRHIQARAS